MRLFANTKMFEDITEYFFYTYFATDDFGKVVEAFAKVLADEVARELHLQTVLYAMNGVEGAW